MVSSVPVRSPWMNAVWLLQAQHSPVNGPPVIGLQCVQAIAEPKEMNIKFYRMLVYILYQRLYVYL